MGIFKKALHSKIDVFVKFESAINLEIRGQIKKKLDSFYLGYKDHMYALSSKSGSEPLSFALFLGDLRWNDPSVTSGILVTFATICCAVSTLGSLTPSSSLIFSRVHLGGEIFLTGRLYFTLCKPYLSGYFH